MIRLLTILLLSLVWYLPAYAYPSLPSGQAEEPEIPIAYTFLLDLRTQQLRAVIDSAEPLHLYFFDLCDVAGESLAYFEKRFAAGENSQNEAMAQWDTSALDVQKLAAAVSVCRLGFFTTNFGPVYRDKAPLHRISANCPEAPPEGSGSEGPAEGEPAAEYRLYMPVAGAL